MATVVGAICCTHVPSIGVAMTRGLTKDAYWAPCFDGFPHAHDWLRKVQPDRAVVVYNTVQHPRPSPKRCHALGQASGRAIAANPEDHRVVLIATGGLSHQLDGTRAGFINQDFDRECIEALLHDPVALTRYSVLELIEKAGNQGVEVMGWLAARASLSPQIRRVYWNYHIPISNTASGLLVMECAD